MYVKRPVKFVYKQYHCFTHKNSIGKSVTDIEKQISIKVLIPNSREERRSLQQKNQPFLVIFQTQQIRLIVLYFFSSYKTGVK